MSSLTKLWRMLLIVKKSQLIIFKISGQSIKSLFVQVHFQK